MKRLLGFACLLLGLWALIAPQANLGLAQLRWLAWHSFPAEAFAGMALLTLGYFLLWATSRDA